MSKRVLVVDDNPIVRGLVLKLLERDGWKPIGVGSLKEALATQGPWNLVIADVRLPNGDGRELRKHMKDVPFLTVSGFPHEIPDLAKPFTKAKFYAAVDLKVGAVK